MLRAGLRFRGTGARGGRADEGTGAWGLRGGGCGAGVAAPCYAAHNAHAHKRLPRLTLPCVKVFECVAVCVSHRRAGTARRGATLAAPSASWTRAAASPTLLRTDGPGRCVPCAPGTGGRGGARSHAHMHACARARPRVLPFPCCRGPASHIDSRARARAPLSLPTGSSTPPPPGRGPAALLRAGPRLCEHRARRPARLRVPRGARARRGQLRRRAALQLPLGGGGGGRGGRWAGVVWGRS
jgi:hypothetical protein